MANTGIQIIGTQRSGSNLLRVILDQSAEIASPHPPHILVVFMPLLPLYGELDSVSYKTLVNDVIAYVNANPVPWEGVLLDAEEIYQKSTHYDLLEINRLVYEQAAISKGAKYWCCKSMANVHYARQMEDFGLNLKYIYLYRDGRDVACSFKKAIVGEKHIYHLAKQWSEDQAACLRLRASLPTDRFFSLNYETLITEPESEIRKLCLYLDIAYHPEMLKFYDSKTSKLTAAAGEMWSNLEKPIISNNTGKFLKEFKGDDLEIFELVAGDILRELDYELVIQNPDERLIDAEHIANYDKENTALKKEALLTARQSDLDNREGQAKILKEIKTRTVAKEL